LYLLSKRLKVFVVCFECWRFIFILLDVEGFYFYVLMFKVIILILKCSKFLLLIFNVQSYCFYFWISKVITFILGCWRFLLVLSDVEGLWFLIFYLFAYIKKMMWKYIPFYLEIDYTSLV
jgi:hypothetical protein